MNFQRIGTPGRLSYAMLLLSLLLMAGCAGSDPASEDERLQVVATTSIIADIVAQVGGEQISLTTLFPVDTDPHSFEATPQDLVTMSDADILFMNGLGLEESIESLLNGLEDVVVLSVNTGVETIGFTGEEAHNDEEDEEHEEHEGHVTNDLDPHTWFSIDAVRLWVENVEAALSQLDPAHAATYAANGAAYRDELAQLEADLDVIVAALPVSQRKLVTDHDALGYLAAAYDFEIVGAVIPSLSTASTPSAQALAALQDQIVATGVSAIFVGVSTNPTIAEQVGQDVGVQIVPIYVDSLSDAQGPASDYLAFMRYTVTTIVEALK